MKRFFSLDAEPSQEKEPRSLRIVHEELLVSAVSVESVKLLLAVLQKDSALVYF